MTIKLEGEGFTLEQLNLLASGREKVVIPVDTKKRLERVRGFIEKKLQINQPFYGINTGFGRLANERIPRDELDKLQENLILSHAVGVGSPLPLPIARLVMLLRANVLAKGYSGIRPETLKLLVDMINEDIIPSIPEQGSVGASGDLAPLAHLALAMIGRGEVFHKEELVPTQVAFKRVGLESVMLGPKEGIALINGTQVMTAMGVIALIRLENLLRVADITGALSVEGDRASIKPFDERIHKLRPHVGQVFTASNVRKLLKGSQIITSHSHCKRVQDPYSLRCIPQVHGAVKDAVAYARKVIMLEVGSCTDNPLIFAEDDEIISGGNFHGEPLAFAMDMIAIAAAELGSISERRVAILTSPLDNELKVKFLTPHPGINSGLMIPHVTMSSLVSENKTLAHPASVDTIPTSGGQEDHVSMGTFAARKALTVISNVETILAIELFASCQAIDLQKQYGGCGKGTQAVHNLVRKSVAHIDEDREYRYDIARCQELVRGGEIVVAAEDACGKLAV